MVAIMPAPRTPTRMRAWPRLGRSASEVMTRPTAAGPPLAGLRRRVAPVVRVVDGADRLGELGDRVALAVTQLAHQVGVGHLVVRHLEFQRRCDGSSALDHEVETGPSLDQPPEQDPRIDGRIQEPPDSSQATAMNSPISRKIRSTAGWPPCSAAASGTPAGACACPGLGRDEQPPRRREQASLHQLGEQRRVLVGQVLGREPEDAALARVLLERAGEARVEVVDAADVVGGELALG